MCVYPTKSKIKEELLNWLDRDDWSNWYAVTLTMKQSYLNEHKVQVYLNDSLASNNLKNFLDKLNYQAFKKAFKRYNKKYQVIPILESHSEVYKSNNLKNYHFHLTLDNPRNLSVLELQKLVLELWLTTDFGDVEIDIQPVNDSGWLKYSTKVTNKNLDNIDFNNLSIAVY